MVCPGVIGLAIAIAAAQNPTKPGTPLDPTARNMETVRAMREDELPRGPTWRRGLWLWLVLGIVGVAASFGGHALMVWLEAELDLKSPLMQSLLDGWLIAALLGIYIVMLALPFVPGAELGILLLLALGSKVALPVYAATVTALVLSFAIGRLVPLQRLIAILNDVGLSRAANLLSRDQTALVQPLAERSSRNWASATLARLLEHRCVALAILINTPGNSLIGGGGGIALMTGASRLITFRQFLVTISIAVAPIPLAILIASRFI